MTLVISKGIRLRQQPSTWAEGGDSVYTINVGGTTYRVHEFKTVGTSMLSVLNGGVFEYLIVGGGGSGGTAAGTLENGGGGGAGGLIEGINTFNAGNYGVSVGQGGPRPTGNRGLVGGDSSLFGLIALGGGSGSVVSVKNGGSGAGGSAFGSRTGGLATQPTSASGGFGNPGGNGDVTGDRGGGGGGGGGAGSAGQNGTATTGGNGGDGRQSSITGTALFYAAGGGGGVGSGFTPGIGGSGIGGNGSTGAGFDAVANTGSGGGGANSGASGGAGGSGIVIVRYAI